MKEVPPEVIVGIIEGIINEIRKEKERTSTISKLCYLVAGWSKRADKVADLYEKIFDEKLPNSDLLTLAVAVITKNLQYIERKDYDELISLYKKGLEAYLPKREEKWRYEVRYHVSSFISGDVIKPLEEKFPETDKRCILCRSPVFTDEPLQMDEYGKAIGGGKGIQQAWTNDDIPFTRKDDYTQSTKEVAKYTRPICIVCKYEATVIGKALSRGGRGISVPFIAVYFRPAIAPEVLSFVALNIERIQVSLSEIYGEEGERRGPRRIKPVLPINVVPNYLGAFVVLSYKECVSGEDSGDLLKIADLSGRRDQVYYGLLLVPEIAKRAGGGQFKICLSEVDILSPPVKLVELPVGIRFVEELNRVIGELQKEVKKRDDKLLKRLYSTSYYYIMRALEGIATKIALWYDHSKVSKEKRKEKRTATWIIRGIEDVENLPLSVALLTPPATGYDIAGKLVQRVEDWTYKRRVYRSRFTNICEIALELEDFLSQVQNIVGGGRYV